MLLLPMAKMNLDEIAQTEARTTAPMPLEVGGGDRIEDERQDEGGDIDGLVVRPEPRRRGQKPCL